MEVEEKGNEESNTESDMEGAGCSEKARRVYCIDMDELKESLARTQLDDKVAIMKELLEDKDVKQEALNLFRETGKTLLLDKTDLSSSLTRIPVELFHTFFIYKKSQSLMML